MARLRQHTRARSTQAARLKAANAEAALQLHAAHGPLTKVAMALALKRRLKLGCYPRVRSGNTSGSHILASTFCRGQRHAPRCSRMARARRDIVLVTEAARAKACSAETVRRAFDRGDITGIRTSGGVRLIDRASLDDWVRWAERRRADERHSG